MICKPHCIMFSVGAVDIMLCTHIVIARANVAISCDFIIILDAVDIMSCTYSILVCANVFAPFDFFIKFGVLDIILWVYYLLFCFVDGFS